MGAAKLSASRSYLQRDLKLLWGLAAGRCSKCKREVAAEATAEDRAAVLGDIAHIAAHGDDGPRVEPSLSADERRRYANLILLCGACHPLVDKQPNTYTIADLRQWKREHEAWVRQRLSEEMPNVSFTELEVVANGILRTPMAPTEVFVLTAPIEKLRKNKLSDAVHLQVHQGMMKSKEVGEFLAQMGQLDPDFPERLRAGFVREYQRLVESEVLGDALFEGLRSFATGDGTFRHQAASLAVIVYFFETCDLFER